MAAIAPRPEIGLRHQIDPRINFAMQQNDVPVVKSIVIENDGSEPLKNLRLLITPEPAFAKPWERWLDLIAAGGTYRIDAIDVQLSPGYLAEIAERVRGLLRFELFQDGACLVDLATPVELLACDEWSGLSSLPEILAAFVMPNHPVVEKILRTAADILRAWSEDSSLAGYQTRDKRRVYLIVAAIYTALQRLDLTYINPPASFESDGQRLRFPDQILSSRMGTCLDLAVLACGCMEQAGLNPLVMIVKGHAFAGVWLQDECFAEPAVAEPLAIRKRIDLAEIAVFDPTCVTLQPSPDFETAVKHGMHRMDDPDEFHCAIDVRRARKGLIRPLPELVGPANVEKPAERSTAGSSSMPDLSRVDVSTSPGAIGDSAPPETSATRLDRWRRKLLDLSLRNRLLNFVETKKTIPLMVPELAKLEDALAEGASFRILPRPHEFGPADPRDREVHRRRTADDPAQVMLREEILARRLRADLVEEELDRRLLETYRAASLSLEEGGANALYLAIGFLAWYETAQSTRPRLAPILLFPVELHRSSVREGFTLRLGDDEPRINITLLEMLRQDHGITVSGLDPLPEDVSGLDVSLILRTIRGRVRDIGRWDVVETAQIGIFSFAKFLMWRDLAERSDELTKNVVVDHLVNRADQAFDPGASLPDPDRLDDERAATTTYCPLPADASQLAAVLAAADGRSFVLEGPPGTGKSQTIANLISHCLAEGKTVLFISEKMAALSVVYSRLKRVGLGRHCMEIHSNKAHKTDVLMQLGDALNQVGGRTPEEWTREAGKLEHCRNELNAYVRALHVPRRSGDTVFHVTSRLIGLRDTHRVPLQWPSPDSIDADDIARLRDVVDRLATTAGALGEVSGHPWSAARQMEWTPTWDQVVRSAIQSHAAAVEALEGAAEVLGRKLSMGERGWSLLELVQMDELANALLGAPAPPATILVRPDWEEIQARIGNWIGHGRKRDALRTEVFARYEPGVLALDLNALLARLTEAENSWWLASWWLRRPVRKAIAAVSKDRRAPEVHELRPLLEGASALRKEEDALADAGDEARAVLGRFWTDGEADWKRIEEIRDWARTLRELAGRAGGADPQRPAFLLERWARLVEETPELLQRDGAIGREIDLYRAAYKAFRDSRTDLNTLLDVDVNQAWGPQEASGSLELAERTLRGWSDRIVQLREWCAWRRARTEAVAANLSALLEAYENGRFGCGDMRQVFDRSYYDWWLGAVVSGEPVLSQFFSPEHQRKIEQFRELDERYMQLTRGIIAGRLASKVPVPSAVDLPNSEVGILRREMAKRKRQMPVRKLFHNISNLLPRLKPCLLMSPMSVAQYLDVKHPPFDLVVFDEASQIPVWDSIGAIARGRQAIIVGDPKQLPPTSFFQRVDETEEEPVESEVVEDLESILDDCMSARLPWLHLDWHYRSRHESLIAFSNYHYYGNRLLTFPSPYREGMGVSWRSVPGGVYDRGKSATNRGEAEAVVAEIVRRLKDEDLRTKTIGVVTFSLAQQRLIEDLLEKARLEDPEIDAHFSEERVEPVFVKNLENVQGDERDVILFSICYGPDAQGRMALNFGPMNREGGERRLNVAVTRARREVMVFSTLRADQIDLARTRARGVRDLKNFLEYAEKGPAALASVAQVDGEADFESPFERVVDEALAKKGWEVHRQVGCARYRIDLAVVDPQAPGCYLLGIECDGANYHRAKVARDRDKLREGILRDLGWRLHRIWSTDWWTNPEQELQKLDAALARAATARGERALKTIIATAPGPGSAISATPMPAASSDCNAASSDTPKSVSSSKIAAALRPAEATAAVPPGSAPAGPRPVDPAYIPYNMKNPIGTQADYYEPSSAGHIRAILVEVVEQEGPISLELATRRVAAHWGFGRVTEKAVNVVRRLIPRNDIKVQTFEGGAFLWPKDKMPETYTDFRVPGSTRESFRAADELPPEEIANAAMSLLLQHVSAPEDELCRELGRLFGFQRMGRIVQERMQAGIDVLVKKGVAARGDAGTVTVLLS